MSEIAIGIDLGTSNSCVAVMHEGRVEVLANAYGEKTTASVVAFRKDGLINVGNAAKANIIHSPERTVHSSKRLIGRYYFSEEVKKAKAICSYEIAEVENHALRIKVDEELFSLPEIGAMILSEMKSIAEARLGQPVTKAVITVPAYFNDNQRQATKDAGRIAGLEVLRIFNEPTAAALAYGFGQGLRQRVAVWDLGGGTFDISVLEIGDDVFEVLATSGDTFLGGEDFDDRLIDLLAEEFQTKTGINLRNDPYALEKLKVAAEGAKKGLSIDDEVEIRIPDVIQSKDGTSHSLERVLTGAEFGVLVNDLLQRTFKVCDEALQQAGVVARDLDGVILVGGPTRLPMVRETVREYFQQETKANVDPDEVVAMGAAIQAAALVSPESEAYLLDVTPLSLRIGIVGGIAETVIERNTPVPIEQTRTFTTSRDGQQSVEIRVYQGESPEAGANELLGQFSFSDFEKADRGDVKIDVTFEINTDGIVNVTAKDQATGAVASTRITLSSGLSEGEVQAIIDGGRTERVETDAGDTSDGDAEEDVLGAISLVSIPADTPVVFEETRDSKRDLLAAEDVDIEPLDEESPLDAEPDFEVASALPEAAPEPFIGREAPEDIHTEVSAAAGDSGRTELMGEREQELVIAGDENAAQDIESGDHGEPDTGDMDVYLDSLPDDSLDLEVDDEGDDLDLLDTEPELDDEIELEAAVEIGGRDEHQNLTEMIEIEDVDPANMDTRPAAVDDLFDAPGTDLSTLPDDESEEAN